MAELVVALDEEREEEEEWLVEVPVPVAPVALVPPSEWEPTGAVAAEQPQRATLKVRMESESWRRVRFMMGSFSTRGFG